MHIELPFSKSPSSHAFQITKSIINSDTSMKRWLWYSHCAEWKDNIICFTSRKDLFYNLIFGENSSKFGMAKARAPFIMGLLIWQRNSQREIQLDKIFNWKSSKNPFRFETQFARVNDFSRKSKLYERGEENPEKIKSERVRLGKPPNKTAKRTPKKPKSLNVYNKETRKSYAICCACCCFLIYYSAKNMQKNRFIEFQIDFSCSKS